MLYAVCLALHYDRDPHKQKSNNLDITHRAYVIIRGP